jgi:hypothetical protein
MKNDLLVARSLYGGSQLSAHHTLPDVCDVLLKNSPLKKTVSAASAGPAVSSLVLSPFAQAHTALTTILLVLPSRLKMSVFERIRGNQEDADWSSKTKEWINDIPDARKQRVLTELHINRPPKRKAESFSRIQRKKPHPVKGPAKSISAAWRL